MLSKELNHLATETVNKHILPQITLEEYGQAGFFSVKPLEVLRMVKEYLSKTNQEDIPKTMVEKGFLYLNGEPIGRITTLPLKTIEEDHGYEERILARQEAFMEV